MGAPEITADLHCHTRFSDGVHSPLEMYQQAVALGLDYLAIADHNTVGGVLNLLQQVDGSEETRVVPGVELSLLSGHFLLLGIQAELMGKQLEQWQLRAGTWLVQRPWPQVRDMLWWTKDKGGQVIAAHPLMPFGAVNRKHLEELVHDDLIQGAEVHNSDVEAGLGFLYPFWQRRVERLVKELEIPAYANSDAHHKNRLGKRFNVFSGEQVVGQSPTRLGQSSGLLR